MDRYSEFPCFFCKEPAKRLVYYSKLYQESGRSTIESPTLTCDTCWKNNETISQLFANRGGLEGIHSRTFNEIVAMSEKSLAVFLSKYGKEKNELANKTWRKRIFRIHYRMRESKVIPI